MPQIRAIVLDSNVFGRSAQPNVKTIEQWADACAQHDAELWIPEIVAHELAQHAVEAHEGFRETYDDRWSDSLIARVELEVEVEEQYARQDPSGQQVEYAARTYPGRVRGTVQTFSTVTRRSLTGYSRMSSSCLSKLPTSTGSRSRLIGRSLARWAT